MQNTEKPAFNGTGETLPPMGPNKIEQAMADYDNMANELQRTKAELLEQIAIGRQLLAENEALRNQMQAQTDFLTQQVDAALTRSHILGATLTALRTNYATIREVFTRCETEALSAGVEAAKALPETPISSWSQAEEKPVLGPVPGDEVPEQTVEPAKPFPKEDDMAEALNELTQVNRRSPAPYQT